MELLTTSSGPATSQSTSGQITEAWLDQKLIDWKPTSAYRLDFGALGARLSYNSFAHPWNSDPVINSSLQMLYSTGANVIRIDMNYDPWLKNDQAQIGRYDKYVASIRANGKQLFIADMAAQSYFDNPQSWSQFKAAWIQRVQTLASRYHPEFYEVVKEPGWYFSMISWTDLLTNPAVRNPSEWSNLTIQLVNAVASVSPTTKIGVADAAGALYHDNYLPVFSTTYLTSAFKMSRLSFVGLDIYGRQDFNDTQRYLSQTPRNGKDIWIPEAWSTSAKFATDPTRAALDAKWIRVLYYFAIRINAQGIAPFFTDLFASYQTPPQDATLLLSYFGNRTPAFYEFQKIILENGPSGGQNTSTTLSSTTTQTTLSATTSSTVAVRHAADPLQDVALVGVLVAIVGITAIFLLKRFRG